ncbi:MAG: hypothetical protein PHC66_04130 [Candidatus Nanoarchaeia archaeon]|nr:hypothetical protein [Candidatus Nanoarchaeia archaeon]MDD5238888.1 hypothetical protein [Candidatus Nanoarchaeia archaeon]
MDKEKIIEQTKKIIYHLEYFKNTNDEARVLEALRHAKTILEELKKE